MKIKLSYLKYLLLLVTAINSSHNLISQRVNGPQHLISLLEAELIQAKKENLDTLSIYGTYLKKIINRGNYIQADSILKSIDNGLSSLVISNSLIEIIKDRAYMYKVQHRFTKSLEDYLRLKTYFENTNNNQGLIEIYNLIAEYYRATGDYTLCNLHLKQAQGLFKITKPSKENLAYWYSRKAAWSNEFLNIRDSVDYYSNQGLILALQTSNVETQALLLNELGYSALVQKQDESVVLSYFNQSKNLLYENERFRGYIDVVNNIASFRLEIGQYQEAISLLEEIIPMEEENQWYGPMQVSLQHVNRLYEMTNQREKYDESLHKLYEIKSQNEASYNAIRVSDLALTYEKNLATTELLVQEQKTIAAQKDAMSKQKAFITALIISIALLLISITSIRVNRKFKLKNQLLNLQQDRIQKTNAELEKLLGQQRVLFKELNHRVKNNLSILTGLIYLQEVGEDDKGFRKALETLRHRIKSMSLAHESLYKTEEAEKIEFQPYLNSLVLDLKSALSNSSEIETIIECEGFKLDLVQAVPLAMIINELFTNSIKHGFPELKSGYIKVKAYHNADFSIIEYSDNGIGFSDEQRNHKTLGIRLVSLLLEQLNATISSLNSKKGVHFELKIPSLNLATTAS